MLKKILIGLAVIVGVFVAVVSMQPSQFKIERSATVAAPADVVFALINDFHQWQGWSPWEKLDPTMKKTHEGPESGTGASYHWVGNKDVGEGKMTITDSKPSESVSIKLEFISPFTAVNTTTFTLSPDGNGTKVNWAMEGNNNFMAKAMGLFMDMDAMVGSDFEKGLAAMKPLAEAEMNRRNAEAAAQAAAAQAAAAAAAPVDGAAVPPGTEAPAKGM